MAAESTAKLPLGFRAGWVIICCFTALILVYLVLPQFIVLPLSFSDRSFLSFPPSGWSTQWYEKLVANPSWFQAMINSLAIGVPTALLSMVFGTMAALAVSRGGFKQAGVISALVVAPMMLPHVILAIGLYPLMLQLNLLGSYAAATIGHTVIGVPLVFITVTAQLARHDFTLELAAMTLGARPWRTFRSVTYPTIRIGIIIGGILAFATSIDELMLALFLTGAGTRTLPRLIWEQMNDYLTPTIAAVATLVFLFTLVLLVIVALIQSRSTRLDGWNHD
ncbi:ABC transporter permease [Hoeflea sp. WL0058]|uniref:ABC transporter permease n=1 Tax=Flavimaribacter sediminis TaxID=2865987 RepID=A0AAE2ZNF8_9HYPH|nr:ABC transporter permease [Flavimaribacter sediminis]MBW8637513.1 ABC transporter permease [Flavimaribacter sediminis]